MTCKNCSRHVKETLQKLPGVEAVEVDLDAGRAVVNGTGVDPKAAISAVERIGYTAAVLAG
jgi:copper chaperone